MEWTMHRSIAACLIAALASALTATTASAGPVTVTSFDPTYSGNGRWFVDTLASGGTASIDSFDDPNFPEGSAKLTTDFTDASKATVGVVDNYGIVSQILSTINLSYDYYKENVVGGNAAAAPSIQLSFRNSAFNPGITDANRNFITLIYEPYYNLGTNPATDQWVSTPVITYTSGRFSSSRGFGAAGNPGGDPLRTLEEWVTALDSTSGGAFSAASLLQVSMNIGSGNKGQIDYFDGVHIGITATGYDATYNFGSNAQEITAATPEPSTLISGGIAMMLGLAGAWRHRRQVERV